MVFLRPDATAFLDFNGHRAADDIARGEVFRMRGITLHEPLALAVDEVAAFAARAFRDEAARAIDAGGVELHELHILQGNAGAHGHAATIAGAGVRRGGAEIGAAIAAGGHHRLLAVETVQRAVIQVPGEHAAALAVIGHQQVEGEIFDEELGLVAQRLGVKRVEDGVAGAVGRGAGALGGGAFAILRGHAAEGALVDFALLGARERHAVMFELDDGIRRLAAHIFDRILVAQPIGALHGVVHVPFPVVRPHVAEGGRDAALRRHRVRAGWEYLGEAGRFQALRRHAEGGAQARAAGADDDDIIMVIGNGIGAGGHGLRREMQVDDSGDRTDAEGEAEQIDQQVDRLAPAGAVDVIERDFMDADARMHEGRA